MRWDARYLHQLQCLFSGKFERISSYKELVHRQIMGCCSVGSWAPNVSLDKVPNIVCACHLELSRTEQVSANLAEKQLLSDVRLLSLVWRLKKQLSITYVYNVSKIQKSLCIWTLSTPAYEAYLIFFCVLWSLCSLQELDFLWSARTYSPHSC